MLEDSSPANEETDSDLKFWDYFNMEVPNSIVNVTDIADVVPAPEQGFVIGVYSALLAAGAVGNVGVFTSLVRSRRRKSRVNLLMTHLVVADMIVTFIVIPLEIGWRTTNAWLAGNMACKFFLVLRAFGLYLSSNILVCISLDRFFAILYPLRLAIARKRSKMMLYMAWLVALLCSLPQSLVFRVMSHPKAPDFQQCVSFEAFANQHQELAYNVFCLCAVYFLPLMIITVCYACIFYEISKNSKENSEKYHPSDHSRVTLRRSDQRPLARARRRTLRMTVTIVTVFACCWLPYATMTLWYMLDRKSAVHVSARVQDLFFIMAVSNSCMDPLVYGSYIIDPRTLKRTIRKIFCIHVSPSDIPGITGPDLKTRVSIRQPSRDTVQSENAGSTLATIVRPGLLTDAEFRSVAMRRAMLCDDDTQTSRISTSPFKIHLTCMRQHKVRFEETALKHTVNSEPIPYWAEHSVDERIVRSSRSCEVFVLRSP